MITIPAFSLGKVWNRIILPLPDREGDKKQYSEEK
jgi:hypothetical protein